MNTVDMDWDLIGEIAATCGTDRSTTSRVINLFNDGNTLPFIARYRKEATGNLDPEALRAIKTKLTQCKEVMEKVGRACIQLSAKGLLTEDVMASLRQCKTKTDVVLITEPLKSTAVKSLAAKARAAGLEPVAYAVFRLGRKVDFSSALVDMTEAEVKTGVLNLMAESICKDPNVVKTSEELCFEIAPILITSRVIETLPNNSKFKLERDLDNFKTYFAFSKPFNLIAPHQVLAINRAEDRKIIRVKMEFHASLIARIRTVVEQRFLSNVHPSHHKLFWDAFEDGWKRLMRPFLTRKLRWEEYYKYSESHITSVAQEISLSVFADNLRRLLMRAPLRSTPPPCAGDLNAATSNIFCQRPQRVPSPEVISASLGAPGDRLPVIGLDPGWRHGTKWAACDPLGDVLATGVIHVTMRPDNRVRNSRNGNVKTSDDDGVQALVRTMRDHEISTIALGNGQACRQTEHWLTQAISEGLFAPLEVRYTIVSEAGASTYSASRLAEAELPWLNVTLRGAVSIARRLQDPLAEMVKVAPQHLGVGMYQHDLPPRRLQAEVEGAMEECISFVGVDVNTAQPHILARVAGLSRAKAQEIINYRRRHGRFRCRNELRKVRGIGPSTFAQCAGFLRVKPEFSTTRMDSSRDVEFISLCTDEEDNGTMQDNESDDVEMEVISTRGKRSRLVTVTPSTNKIPRLGLSEPDPKDFSFNPLDQTAIHPASYHVATALIGHLNFEISDVGCMALRNRAKALFALPNRDTVLSRFTTEEFGLETVRDILDTLCRPLDFDEREDRFRPMFRSSVVSIAHLRPGTEVTGCVSNVTTFGAFVDIGVEEAALIPLREFPSPHPSDGRSSVSKVGGAFSNGKSGVLQKFNIRLGDRVKGKVERVCVKSKHITLRDIHLFT